MTDGDRVDLIFDPVLGTFFNENMSCLAQDARWIIYGAMGGAKVTDANMMKVLGKRASILTSTLRNRSDAYKTELVKAAAAELIPAFGDGKLKPIIDKVYDLTEA